MTDITPLSGDELNKLVDDFEASEHNRMAMNAVTAAGIDKVARNYDRARLMQRRFSTVVDNGTVTHQDRSGRCWLFSSLNVARFVAKQNMGLKEFEFSQNYAMYYDKLERVNYFLKDVAALVEAGEPADSRLMQHLLSDVMGDGGQWTMAMNVYKKYGAVPKDLFPETESSKNTGEMNVQLRRMLHTDASDLGQQATYQLDALVEHFNVATQRNKGDDKLGAMAIGTLPERFTKTNGKSLDPHTATTSNPEMAKFMHGNQYTQCNNERRQIPENAQHKFIR